MFKYFFNKHSANTGGFRRYVAREITIGLALGTFCACMYWQFYRKPYFEKAMALDKELMRQHAERYGPEGFSLSEEEKEKLK